MYNEGLSLKKIEKEINIPSSTIQRLLVSNNVPSRKVITRHEVLTDEDETKIIDLYEQGLSSPKIAEQLNMSPAGVLKCLKRNDVERRDDEECRRQFKIRKNFFDNIDSEEKAYVLGFIYADGCNMQKNNFVRIDISAEDDDILKKMSKVIYLEDSEEQVKYTTRVKNKNGIEKIFHHCYLGINSKYICGKLNELGCTSKKSLTLVFPEWLKDPELQRHFIRGYYDGDGGIYISYKKGGSSTLSIISTKEFIESIKQIIGQQTNTNFYVSNSVEDKNVYRMYAAGNQQIKRILDWLYKDSTIYLDRKYNLYLELNEKINETQDFIMQNKQGYSKRYLIKKEAPIEIEASFKSD